MKELIAKIYKTDEGNVEFEKVSRTLFNWSVISSKYFNLEYKLTCPHCKRYMFEDIHNGESLEDFKERITKSGYHTYCGYCGHKNIEKR